MLLYHSPPFWQPNYFKNPAAQTPYILPQDLPLKSINTNCFNELFAYLRTTRTTRSKTYLTGFTGLTGKFVKPHCSYLAAGEAQ
jgi:hypothetical protein